MDPLPIIPTPPSQKWREFRIRYLPLLVFVLFFIWAGTLWKTNITAPTTTGQTESIIANVTAPENGVLTNLLVTRFQTVTIGDPIAELIVTDYRSEDLRLNQLRTKLDMAQAELGTMMGQDRLAFDYESLRLAFNRDLVDIEATRAELKILDKTLLSLEKGVQEQVIPRLVYEESLRSRDGLRARLDQSQKHSDILKLKLDEARHYGNSFSPSSTNSRSAQLLAEIETDREKLTHLTRQLIVIRAPVSGRVNLIARYSGQNVVTGETIIAIVSEETPRIIAFLHTPLPFEPRDGMEVTVRRRSSKREQALAEISAVGPQMEPVTQALLRPGTTFEIALPIAVSIPEGMKLIPGELVDLIIRNN